MTEHMLRMAATGLLVSVGAPLALVLLLRVLPRLERFTVPAAVVWPGFVVLHFAVTMLAARDLPRLLETAAQVVLVVGAVLFWAPIFGARHRLPEAGRTLYLYAGMPMLDLAGVWLAALGDLTGGLSMIVGMLPMGLTAVAITWTWIHREERRATLDDPPMLGEPTTPDSGMGGARHGTP